MAKPAKLFDSLGGSRMPSLSGAYGKGGSKGGGSSQSSGKASSNVKVIPAVKRGPIAKKAVPSTPYKGKPAPPTKPAPTKPVPNKASPAQLKDARAKATAKSNAGYSGFKGKKPSISPKER